MSQRQSKPPKGVSQEEWEKIMNDGELYKAYWVNERSKTRGKKVGRPANEISILEFKDMVSPREELMIKLNARICAKRMLEKMRLQYPHLGF